MKLNPSQSYISLILNALEHSVMPELKSASARGSVDMIRAALIELHKRLGPSSVLLRACIAEGEALERELRAFPGVFLGDAAAPQDASASAGAEGFEALAARHAALTQRLGELCARIANPLSEPEAEHAAGAAGALLLRAARWELSYYTRQAQIPFDPPAAAAGSPLTREFLQGFLNERRTADAGPVEVRAFDPVLGGFGKQTFLCRVIDQASGVERELVVRKSDPVPIMMHGFCIIEREHALLRCLAQTDFPSPRPQHLASQLAGVDASFYTMDRIPGRVPGSFLGGLQHKLPEELFLQLAALLAQLHRIPLETFGDYFSRYDDAAVLSSSVGDCYRRNLAGWRRYAEQTEHLPSPYLSWLLDWLERNAPQDARRPVLVHGDFNIHNVLAENGRITGVLDWECADFGAPEQDLAYIQSHIAQHIEWQRFLDHYRACGGPELDARLMPFCRAYAALRTNLAGNRGTLNLQRGSNLDIRYVMIELGFTPAFMQLGLASAGGS